jgi:hypothetical protein
MHLPSTIRIPPGRPTERGISIELAARNRLNTMQVAPMRKLFVVVFFPVAIQAQNAFTSVADSLTALQRFLVANGKAAAVLSTVSGKFDSSVELVATCQVAVTLTAVYTDEEPWVTRYLVDLTRMSPEVVSSRPDVGTLFEVRVVNTSGEDDVPYNRTGAHAASGTAPQFFMQLSDSATAQRVVGLWSSAIRGCGGKARSQAVKARVAELDAVRKKSLDRILGRSLSDSVKASVVRLCQEMTKLKLRAPATAVFPSIDDTNISDREDGSLLMFGMVQSQNGFGGMTSARSSAPLKSTGTHTSQRAMLS